MTYTERHVRARKPHLCVWCGQPIRLGETHVIATEYPGGDGAGYADTAGHPVRMRVHAAEPCHYPQEES